MVIGKTLTIDELFEMGFEAVFMSAPARVCRGSWAFRARASRAYIPPTNILTRINLMKAYLPDSEDARSSTAARLRSSAAATSRWTRRARAKRLGAEEVYIVYRRGMEELPARKEEVEHAEEEGIIFKTLTNPVEVLGRRKRRGLRHALCGDGAG